MFRKFRENLMLKADAFVQFTVDVIYDRRQGKAAEWYALFLNLLSYLYGFAVRLRLYLYEHRYRPHRRQVTVTVLGEA